MGCDGIFDKLTNKEIIDMVWDNVKTKDDNNDVHKECATSVDLILSESVRKKTLDNITVVMIAFSNFK
jgi:protein phosphatase 2C family protein 2/3